MALWCHVLEQKGLYKVKISLSDAIDATKNIFEKVDGAYAVVGVMAHLGLFAFRDPKGMRPLALGKRITEEGVHYCVVSETAALHLLSYEFVRDVQPGELICITPQGDLYSQIVQKEPRKAHCMFEWVYFAGAESTLDQKSVYRTRLQLEGIGQIHPECILRRLDFSRYNCPIPDTSRPAAVSLAEEVGIHIEKFCEKSLCTTKFYFKHPKSS